MTFYQAINRHSGKLITAGKSFIEVEARAKESGVSFFIEEVDENELRNSLETASNEKKYTIRARV